MLGSKLLWLLAAAGGGLAAPSGLTPARGALETTSGPMAGTPLQKRYTFGQVIRHAKQNKATYVKVIATSAQVSAIVCAGYNYASDEMTKSKKAFCLASAIIGGGYGIINANIGQGKGTGAQDHIPLSGTIGVRVQKGTPFYNAGHFPGSAGLTSAHTEFRRNAPNEETNATEPILQGPPLKFETSIQYSDFFGPIVSKKSTLFGQNTTSQAVGHSRYHVDALVSSACGVGYAPDATINMPGNTFIDFCDPQVDTGPMIVWENSQNVSPSQLNDWMNTYGLSDALNNDASFWLEEFTHAFEDLGGSQSPLMCICAEVDGAIAGIGGIAFTRNTGWPVAPGCYGGESTPSGGFKNCYDLINASGSQAGAQNWN